MSDTDVANAPDITSALAGAPLPAAPLAGPPPPLPADPLADPLAPPASMGTVQGANGPVQVNTNAPDFNQNANVPDMPPTPAQPGMWKTILAGALSGLSGVPAHGRSSFLNGAIGGAKAGIEAQQQAKDNAVRQQQLQNQTAETQSNIQFQNLRAAQSVAEETRKVQEFHNLDKEQQLEISQKTAEHNVYMQEQGLEPDVTAADTSDSAHGMLKTISDMNGGKFPEVSVNHDPSKGTVSVYAPTAADDPAKKNAQLDFINKGRGIIGLPPITMDAIRKPADRAAAFHDAFEVTNPIPTDVNPNNVTTMLNNTQQQRDRWAKSHPDDTSTLTQLDNRVASLKKSQDAYTKAKTDAEAQGEQAKLNVENTPANQQAAARGAGLKTGAEKTAELNAVAADQAKQNKGDPTLGGQDYINSLPPERGATIKAIGEGRQVLTSGMLRTKTGIEIAGQVNRAYPGFDFSRSEAYGKARDKFTSGPIAEGINHLNTAAVHLGLLYDSSTTSATGPMLSWTSRHIVQPFSKSNTNATNFEQYKDKVEDEIQHAYDNKALTDQDHKAMKNEIDGWTPNTARAQERALGTLLESKLNSYKSEWNTAKPSAAVPDIPIINPEAANALARVTGKPVSTITAPQSRQTLPNLSPAAQNFVNKYKPQQGQQ